MRLGDFRFHLRRSETVLPAVWKDGMEADKVSHCVCHASISITFSNST